MVTRQDLDVTAAKAATLEEAGNNHCQETGEMPAFEQQDEHMNDECAETLPRTEKSVVALWQASAVTKADVAILPTCQAE